MKGCLLHGGAEDDHGRRTFGDAWLFQGTTWKRLEKSFDTDPRDDHGLGYHRGASRLVMLEGVAGTRGILVREPTGWRAVAASPLHPRHQCSPLAWNDELEGLLLHGGELRHGGYPVRLDVVAANACCFVAGSSQRPQGIESLAQAGAAP